ncbi:MAG TPA: VWA domain-containing protein [Ktedonobacterales bacterium]
MFDRFRFRKPYRYSRWDGTQRLDDLDAESILDALSDDYMRQGDLRRSLERMMREGFRRRDGQRQMGLQELMERLRQQRQQRMQRYNMDGVMQDILEKLEHVKELERDGIQRRLDGRPPRAQDADADQGPAAGGAEDQANQSEPSDGAEGEGADASAGERGQPGPTGRRQSGRSPRGQAGSMEQPSQPGESQSGQPGDGQPGTPEGLDPAALRRALENVTRRKLDYLDQLPPDPAGQIKQLSEYDFMDEQARQEFQDLLAMLQQQVMQQYFQGMQQAIQNMTPEDLARMRDMVRELNQMLRERAEGGEPDFDSFMQKYGDFFPGVNSLDDLIEQLQRSMAQMQAVMDSMSPEQREQLNAMMDQLIGDDRLRVDLAQLAMNLDAIAPLENVRTRFPLTGDEPLSLAEAMHLMGVLQEMDALERTLQDARRTGDPDDLDPDKMRALVGDDEAAALLQLQEMLKQLEEEGYVRRNGERLEMTSRGIRRIGQHALEDIFSKLQRDGFGRHRLPERGSGGERVDESKPYVFGDPFLLDLKDTVMNGLRRQGPGTPVQLERDDFTVFRAEHLTTAATVLMLDMSWSMLINELWEPAKKVAIALESLIRGQFPRDDLFLVGFSNMAREYQADELMQVSRLDHVQGTNMVHGLMLARQLLAHTHAQNKQIIMITDGGPTMWQEGAGWNFDWPPPEVAILQTLREVHRATREGVTINIFMLWDDPYLKHFVNQMAGVNKGRAFFVSPEDLGEYLVVDYLNSKRKRVS